MWQPSISTNYIWWNNAGISLTQALGYWVVIKLVVNDKSNEK